MSILSSATLRLFAHVLPRLALSFAVVAWGWACAQRAVRRQLGALSWDLSLMAGAVLFALALTLPGLVLGACGLLRDWTWALGAIVTFTVLRFASPARNLAPPESGPGPSAPFAIALGGVTLGRILYSLRNPPADWDSFHYHLPMIAAWMQTGSLTVPMHVPPPFGQFFPGSGELLETWMAWSTGRDTLVTWVGLLGLALLAVACRRLARMAGAPTLVAEACVLLAVASPGVTQLTMGAKVDHLLAAWFAISLLFALRYRAHRAAGDLMIVLCAIGLLPGVKTTGPVYAAMALALALFARGAAGRMRDLLSHRVALAAALFSGVFWYARNLLATGNAFYPAGYILAGRRLPGLLSQETLRRTTQLFVWLEGHDGHLTVRNLLRWFGPGIVALSLGVIVWLVLEARRVPGPGADGTRRRAGLFAGVMAACGIFYLFTPFSGLYLPAEHGHPLRLNLDNLRLLLPTAVAALPLAAVGLARLGPAPVVSALLAVLWLFGLGQKLTHIGPGIVVVALLYAWLGRGRALRAPKPLLAVAAAAAVIVLAAGVAVVDPLRERGEARAWDGFLPHIQNMDWASVRRMREDSGARPIAIVGPASWWALYGRDFSGHPAYVPVSIPWAESEGPFRLLPEHREGADHDRWLGNLEASGARYLVVSGLGDSCAAVPEQSWCRADTVRFERIDSARCAVAYRVRLQGPGTDAHAARVEP